jgi:ERCC4-related helicase
LVEPPSRLRLKPRRYQLEAFDWAYRRGRAVIVLPTGTGKTLVAVMWALKLLEEGRARQVLFLEPTRFLVEQVASYIGSVACVEAQPVHGAVPQRERWRRWAGRIVVATPEIVVSDAEHVLKQNFDALVVDECHHTTGKDAYVKAIRLLSGKARFRLGLSAYIPPSRRAGIERDIGPIREWSWSDPTVAPYIPPWIGEVYEAQLNEAERRLATALEELSSRVSGGLRAAVRNALRWFVRDGALALRDSLQRPTMLAAVLRQLAGLINDERVRPSHKVEPLLRILADHEGFSKSIVFIDRVVVAEYACKTLEEKGYPCVLIRGRMGREKLREALEKARSADVRVIVSTSAGEEGVDLPDADLLVMWSITASPLRFIQRHGRVLRATEQGRGRLRFVAYIVTLDTIDVDSFVDAIETARRIGVDIPVDESTVERLWRRTTRSRIVAVLEGNPMPLDVLAEATGIPRDRLVRDVRRLLQHGDLVYIYTPIGRIFAYQADIELLKERYAEYLEPDETIVGKVKYKPLASKGWARAVSGTYSRVFERLAKRLEEVGAFERLLVTLTVPVSGVLRLVNLNYTFLIDSVEKLELALRNAFAAPRILGEEGALSLLEPVD